MMSKITMLLVLSLTFRRKSVDEKASTRLRMYKELLFNFRRQ